MVDEALLSILRCPETGEQFELLGPSQGMDAWLRTASGTYAYPVREGIISLLPASAARLEGGAAPDALDPVKAGMREFYDRTGWSQTEDGFRDAELFEDLRPVSRRYIHEAHLRVRDHLPPGGRWLLDAASGPVQFPEYVTYQEAFDKRICLDLSVEALHQAQRVLGDDAVYIQGDVTRLPFADQSVDAAVSLHTIYHVPADEQESAFLELYRVVRPGGRAVVVYEWKRTVLWRALEAPHGIVTRLTRLAQRLAGRPTRERATDAEDFYFRPQSRRWFFSRAWPFRPALKVWRFPSVPTLKFYVHRWLGGRLLLRLLWHVETRWPEAMGRHGKYPLIVIERPGSPTAEVGP